MNAKRPDDWIEHAIDFARGDSFEHFGNLSPRERNTAELGARRAIAFLVDKGFIKDEFLQQNQ